MLVLSRKKGERVLIGKLEPVEVVVVEIRGDKVRLGFQASLEVPVHRLEVFNAIERRKAADMTLAESEAKAREIVNKLEAQQHTEASNGH